MQQHSQRDRRYCALYQRARYGHAPHRDQLTQVNTQSNAEEQQNDAHFGKLFGNDVVDDNAGGKRADCNASQQVANDWC